MTRLKLLLIYPVLVLAALLGLLTYAWFTLINPKYAWPIALGFDQVGNASFKGSEDETISSRAAKGARKGIWHWCLLCRLLHWLDANHCESSIEVDEGKPV